MTYVRGKKSALKPADIQPGFIYQGCKGGDVRCVVARVKDAVTYQRPGKALTLTTNVHVFARWATMKHTQAELAELRAGVKHGPADYWW